MTLRHILGGPPSLPTSPGSNGHFDQGEVFWASGCLILTVLGLVGPNITMNNPYTHWGGEVSPWGPPPWPTPFGGPGGCQNGHFEHFEVFWVSGQIILTLMGGNWPLHTFWEDPPPNDPPPRGSWGGQKGHFEHMTRNIGHRIDDTRHLT